MTSPSSGDLLTHFDALANGSCTMATRELRKKRGTVNPSPARCTGLKGRDERMQVKNVLPAQEDNTETDLPEKAAKGGKQKGKIQDAQEENTKDTGQEKYIGAPAEGGKSEPQVPAIIRSPHYTRSPREKIKERSASSFHRNVVEPLLGTSGAGSNMGSTTSVRSHASSKEAWPEKDDRLVVTTNSNTTDIGSAEFLHEQSSRPSSSSSNKEQRKDRSSRVDTISIRTDTSEQPEQNAYIPYTYARDCIARVAGDMSDMKAKHVRIVKDIEKHYRAIEDETQVQFNSFVFMLRQQYAGKVTTFRQVIELHRSELQQKEHYWAETLESMTKRINRLLKDRKILLINHREEMEKVEKEKALLLTHLTSQMDHEKSSAAKEYEKRLKEQDDKIGQLRAEKKRMQDELETEKREVIQLKDLVAVGAGGTIIGAAAVAADKDVEKEKAAMLTASPPTGQTDDVGADEHQRMSLEHQQMSADMGQATQERRDLMEKIKSLEADVTCVSLESAEWQEKYRLLVLQAGDAAKLREQFAHLESQYNALALVVKTTPEASQAAEEKMSQVTEEKAMMEAERQHLAKEIEKWEKKFKKKNRREPTEEDKPDSAKEMYIQMEEVKQMVDSLDRQKATLQAVQSGTVPPTPDVPPVPVTEPEVSVVEVKVPDPDIVASLECSQAAVDHLQSWLAALQEENMELLAQIAGLQAGGPLSVGAGAALVQSDDSDKVEKLTSQLDEKEQEVEALRAEKREMSKDMKKMIRQHAKLQVKMAESDPDLAKLVQMMAVLVQSIHGDYPGAARAVEQRLVQAEATVKPLQEKESADKKALHAWDKKYKKAHGKSPEDSDRDEEGQVLKAAIDDSSKALEIKQIEVRALTLLHIGIVKSEELQKPKSATSTAAESDVDQQLSDLDNKIIDLEGEKEKLEGENSKLMATVEDLEEQILNLKEQLAVRAAMGATAQESTEDVSDLQQEMDDLNAALQQERTAHDNTQEELEAVQKQLQTVQEELTTLQGQAEANVQKATAVLKATLASKEEKLSSAKKQNEELEKERLANVPLDTAKEIKNLQNKIAMLEKEKEQLSTSAASQGAAIQEVRSQLEASNKTLEALRAANRDLEGRVRAARADKEKAVKELTSQVDKKEQQRAALETKLKQLQAAGGGVAVATAVKAGGKAGPTAKGGAGGEDTAALKREIRELNACIKQLEMEARHGAAAGVAVGAAAGDAADKNVQKRHEKILKELAKKYEIEQNRTAKLTESLKEKDEELKTLQKDVKEKDAELTKLQAELALLGAAAKEGVEAAGQVKALEAENKKLLEENKVLTENYNSERVLRKKYYNMVEDMKGKIRVYCRARPLSTTEKERGNFSAVKSPDEYSIQVESQRGLKEFQFDQMFMEDSTQERIFEDTNNLIQSAVDGYNVCIFAYGQTGSGKTFTMIGDHDGRFPGIAPRAFARIFELGEENKAKFDLRVTTYMLELYNDKLIDLFAKPGNYNEDKLEIKKDKKGMVFVQGAVVKSASHAKELHALFEEGSKNRHTASTKMNAESSRSHLVIGVVMESTSKSTGTVLKGKLSLVDLAGSERVGKTGATADQLKEAMSINKSLSALGDVISALSSEQSFIPYRNNKLTMLMQDSLGGNAKTLMFVNVSPADYNVDETVISLTYASRVKLITNDASKNADNKEIGRLKGIIAKLKAGEKVEEEDL